MEVFNYVVDRLWSGRVSLAKIYWGYFVVGGLLWTAVLAFIVPGSSLAVAFGVLFCAYYVLVSIGIWRSAEKYKGPVIWAGLAKMASLGGVLYVYAMASVVLQASGLLPFSQRAPVEQITPSAPYIPAPTSPLPPPAVHADKPRANTAEPPSPIVRSEKDRLDVELAAMDQLRPGWRQKVQSQQFQVWLASQPEAFRNAFEAADSAGTLAPFIDRFDHWMVEQHSKPQKAT